MNAQIHELLHPTDDEELVCVPEGEYELSYVGHTTWLYLGRYPKIVVSFRIASHGEHFDKKIMAYYNPSKLMGKPRKNGHFSVGWRSKFMWDFTQCFGKPARKDRISMCRFKEHLVIAKVRTVKHNRKQKAYPTELRYSVVDELLGVVKP